jgi:hypothetical protein
MDHHFLTLIHGGGPLRTIQRFNSKCDEALSNFAFNFNLRHYNWDCPHTPWDVVFVKENRVGWKKTDTPGTSERLSDITTEELEAAAGPSQPVLSQLALQAMCV